MVVVFRICICGLLVVLVGRSSAGEKEPRVLKGQGWVASVAFSPDGKILASAGSDGVVRLWDVATGKQQSVLKGHADAVCAVAFAPDKLTLATASFDHTAKVWEFGESQVRFDLRKWGQGPALTVAFHPTKPLLVSGGTDGIILVHDLRTEKQKSIDVPLHPHRSWVNSLAFNKDGSRLASGSSDGKVRLWNTTLNGWRPILEFDGNAGEVRSVAFSPDGKLLAAGNRYCTVRVWDIKKHEEKITLKGHASDVWAIAFSPDGKTLATADTDWKKPSKVKLWDTASWQERGALDCPGEILCIAYSPKGDWLAVGSWDRTVRLFPIGP